MCLKVYEFVVSDTSILRVLAEVFDLVHGVERLVHCLDNERSLADRDLRVRAERGYVWDF